MAAIRWSVRALRPITGSWLEQTPELDAKALFVRPNLPPTKVAGCYSVAVDTKHNLIWVSEQQADQIARFDPKTKSWLEFSLPYAQSDDRRISVDPTDPGRIFFSGATSNLIGFVEYDPR